MLKENQYPAILFYSSRRKGGGPRPPGPQPFSINRGLSTLTLGFRLALRPPSGQRWGQPSPARSPWRSPGSFPPVFPSEVDGPLTMVATGQQAQATGVDTGPGYRPRQAKSRGK